MAKPTCPKCSCTTFEIQEIPIKGARYRHNAINCTACGAIIAVHEFFNVNANLAVIAQKFGIKL